VYILRDVDENFFPVQIIKVPAGTVIREVMQHDESMPLRDCPTVDVADLASSGNRIMAAKGGAGGLGNKSFRNALRKAPTVRQEGQPGEARVLELELKTIADVGLVGFPNAGKSTFLSAVSAAEPKIAPYPFTTLHPYVGMVEYDKLNLPGSRLSIADLPGLIDGAHLNRGLGHSFLRHIERTKILLYVLDIVGSEGRDPIDDFTILQRELELYARDRKIAGGLIERPSLILANKLDLDATKAAKNIERLRKHTKLPIFAGSAQRGEKLAPVLTALRRSLLLELQPVKWPQGRVAGPPKVIPRTL
jgi:GTP-binding protein